MCDSNINFVSNHIRTEWYQNWNARADIQYKFAYLERNENGGWLKAHTLGLFVNYGKNSGSNVQRMFPGRSSHKVDVLKPARGFMEAELGVMLREELRLSGGAGMMKFNKISDGVASDGSQYYYTCTAGLSPRIFDWLDTEMNLTWMLINGKFIPRIGVNALFLLKTGDF